MTTLAFTKRLSRNLSTLFHPLQRRSSIAQLSTLDDRLLKDIGLSRHDVDDMRRMW
jgi:uncharacterized protein YjiS (DUF1127 family)